MHYLVAFYQFPLFYAGYMFMLMMVKCNVERRVLYFL